MEGPVAAAFVAAAVRAAGVRRMGWNWNWEGDVVVDLGSMEGRWTIVRSVRRVREESKGGIFVVVVVVVFVVVECLARFAGEPRIQNPSRVRRRIST